MSQAQIIRNSEVKRPVVTPLSSTLLDHLEQMGNVVNLPKFGLRNNEGLWPSYNCLDTLVPTPMCPDPLAEGFLKTFGIAPWTPAFEFAVHGGVQCQTIGLDVNDQAAELDRVFKTNESKGVERALLLNRFVATTSDDPVQWDAPVDLTPGAAIPLHVALALLEGYAASIYAGTPIIHMSRAAASLLNERIVWKDGLAFTRTGARVAVGGGYDPVLGDGETPDNEWDMYVTGVIYVERSDYINQQTMVMPGDGSGTGSGENGLEQNTTIALVERAYRVAVDCFVAKVTGTVWTA